MKTKIYQERLFFKETSDEVRLKFLLFVISPVLAFAYSLRKVNTKSSFVIFYLFAVVFGISFTNTQHPEAVGSLDSARYIYWFSQYQNVSLDEFLSNLKTYLSFNTENKDFFFNTIAFVLSRITMNYHVLFCVMAMIFAYFQLKSLKFLVCKKEYRNCLLGLLLCFLFTYNGIFNINGIRFWLAAWICVFCLFKIYVTGNKNYYFLVLVLPFVHGAYFLIWGVFLLIAFFRRYEKVWLIVVGLSFILSGVAISISVESADNLPPFLSKMVSNYTNDIAIENSQFKASKYAMLKMLFEYLKLFYVFLMAFCLIRERRKRKQVDVGETNIYQAFLIWVSFCNFSMSIPAVGRRFIVVAYPLLAYLWLSFWGLKRRNWILYFLPVAFFYDLFWQTPVCYTTVLEPEFFFASPIYLIIKNLII